MFISLLMILNYLEWFSGIITMLTQFVTLINHFTCNSILQRRV